MAARKRPAKAPRWLVTSKDAEELARRQGKLEEARRVLRQTGDPWAALKVLGLTKPTKAGRTGRSKQELERLVGLYQNMTSAPGPDRPLYARTERMDLLYAESAAWVEYQGGRGPYPGSPDPDGYYEPDADVPMGPKDALRNVAAYMGVGIRHAYETLKRAGATGLPPRP
jgi:hypothetical protein